LVPRAPWGRVSKLRKSQDGQTQNICEAESHHIRPKAAFNAAGVQRFIVNSPDGDRTFEQRVHVSVCESAGTAKCRDAGDAIGDEFFCKQEYSKHKLVVVLT
jgi:hypothetical protein